MEFGVVNNTNNQIILIVQVLCSEVLE